MSGTQARFLSMVLASAAANAAFAVENVTSGPETDYQASVIRSSDDGARIVVFERIETGGDLWITRSIDDGASWSEPVAVIATGVLERHPALLQIGPANYVLFYLKGTSSSNFRIMRATSSDGIGFAEQGALDLGWKAAGEINPHVIRHADGTLTMSYQRFGVNVGERGSYVAQSADDGVTWDTLRTPIAVPGQLPRITYRESDGLYLASYQTGGGSLNMYVKTSTDVHDWSAPPQDFAVGGNNHDSLPVVMPDDAFVLFWIRENGFGFDIAARRSLDGLTWDPAITITDTPDQSDVEPHPLITSASTVELYWGRSPDNVDYDIVREPEVRLFEPPLFADGFDPPAP